MASPTDSIATPPTDSTATPPVVKEEEKAEEEGKEKAKEKKLTKKQICLRGCKYQWRFFFMIFWPMFSALLFIAGTNKAWRCLYVTVVMAGYWICEVLPLGVTGLIPVALFPLLGILDTKTTCMQYMKDTNVMFLAALFMAFAIEACNLHTRIALAIVLLIGTTHIRLTLGFMMVTMFVSMWIVNTAATAMMAPVAFAVLKHLEEEGLVTMFDRKEEDEDPYPTRTTRCYLFGIAYASTIGGIGTLVGTGTNLTFKGIFETKFTEAPSVDFMDWMGSQIPIMLVSNILTWAALSWQYLGLGRNTGMDPLVKQQKLENVEQKRRAAAIARLTVKEKLRDLGSFTWGEFWVSGLFLILIALWITRDPNYATGWAPLITDVKVQDATPAVGVVIILFMLPATTSILHCLSKDDRKRPDKTVERLLTWKFVQSKMMWGLLFLLGSGFALAQGFESSGLSRMIGDALQGLNVLHRYVVLMICCFFATNATEFTANVAVSNIILPVLAQMAVVLEINPIYLMVPATLCCSFSFMLPMGTPSNAVVAGYGNIRTKDMIVTGIAPTIITFLAVISIFPTWGKFVYRIGGFPDWAKEKEEES